MVLAAALIASVIQQSPHLDIELFKQRAEEALLAGEGLQPDFGDDLLAMAPADRLEAIIYLRHLGLLTGESWTLDDLLKPASDSMRARE